MEQNKYVKLIAKKGKEITVFDEDAFVECIECGDMRLPNCNVCKGT